MELSASTLYLTEQGEVVMIVFTDRINLGSRDAAGEELSCFLVEVGIGECGQ